MTSFRDRPIFVVGHPRSGTSLVAGLMHACGCWFGNTVPGNYRNPKGFFENRTIRDGVVKTMLQRMGCPPGGAQDIPELSDCPTVDGLKETVDKIITSQGYDDSVPWAYKEVKLTLLLPTWIEAWPNAVWIIVRRNTDVIVRSCLRVDFMNQHSNDPAFFVELVRQYEQRMEFLWKAEGVNCYQLWPQCLVEGDREVLQVLFEELGLVWDEAAVDSFIDAKHWHAPT